MKNAVRMTFMKCVQKDQIEHSNPSSSFFFKQLSEERASQGMCYFCWFLKYNYGFSKQRTEKASEAEKIVYEKSMRKEIDGYWDSGK